MEEIFLGESNHEIPSSSCLTCHTIIPNASSFRVNSDESIKGGIQMSCILPSPFQPAFQNNSFATCMYGSAFGKSLED
ncbi:hypothetical protein IUY40_12785 [Flavobacterium sp. ALJ2]|uniref:hypothetical protein n=1 Tax=Flavobacterium sp. ALJ2 TaxID=2786960 RepID=UPI00189C720F|nr:hypothetical protein [Flavobacterium sp. ALJ2]MBF7092412.1 hypothetical protein [Flavobacterium sp. ALJ2]